MSADLKEFFLECPNCGAPMFEHDGLEDDELDEDRQTRDCVFSDDECETCQECGAIVSIGIDDYCDEPRAYTNWQDEFEDKGQTRCDGSCGAGKEYVGTPCSWDCQRAKKVEP